MDRIIGIDAAPQVVFELISDAAKIREWLIDDLARPSSSVSLSFGGNALLNAFDEFSLAPFIYQTWKNLSGGRVIGLRP